MNRYGKYHDLYAAMKANPKNPLVPFKNNITRRNKEIAEDMPARQPSTSAQSAALKVLRLYRAICRMVPYIVKIHEMYLSTKVANTGPHQNKQKSLLATISEAWRMRPVWTASTGWSTSDTSGCTRQNGIIRKPDISTST